MSNSEQYDAVVLGCGAGGKLLGWTLASQGKRVAVIERRYIGGSCPNIACLPSKNVVHSAKVASYFRRSAEFGIAAGDWTVDMSGVRDRKRKMVDGLVALHLDKFKASGAELVHGTGRFVAPKTIEVALRDGGTRVLSGEIVVIDTGTRARIDPIPGLKEARPLTHIEALELDTVPKHLIILGGGYVGLEFAQAFRRFGSDVTIVERNGVLAHREDRDVSDALHQLFCDEGIEVSTNTSVDHVEGLSGQSVSLHATRNGKEVVIAGTHLLAAGGRVPNTDGIGLELAGVEVDARGFVKVNDKLQTTAENVWAVGDCAGSPMFTHIGENDFLVVRDNLAGKPRTTTGRQVPYCLFTDPELARIGLNETEAKDRGIAYRLARLSMEGVLRARTLSETRGFMKALVEADGDRILGFTAFGPEAGEVMAVVQVAMIAGLPYTALRDAVLTHPTMAEGLASLFSTVPARV
jgi:pyruvate/2-oxoglutarate dehydrogenase complex dihydrolipoamide dehydrogenase (E3) component